MIRPLPVALALVLAAPLAAQSADAPAHRTPVATGLVLKPSAEVTGDSVLLRDVADLPDDCPWAAVEIGPAPLPGRQRTITAPQVELRLGRAGFAKLGWSLLVHPTHQRSPDYLYLHDLDRAVVDCDRPTPLQVDGEDIGDVTEVVLESERDALTVLV